MHTDERSCIASATATFVLMVDFPIPPFAPKIVMIVPAVAALGICPNCRSLRFSSDASAVITDCRSVSGLIGLARKSRAPDIIALRMMSSSFVWL